ncbi:MAG TPA: hypothetical protein H9909_03215 [Candidatus Mediterraneibacter norfolkensis]|nr:hypothetical protein [Candidatus Mediterraneibacter norfolkensis]
MSKEYEGILKCCSGCKMEECDPENCNMAETEIMMDQMDSYYEDVIDLFDL